MLASKIRQAASARGIELAVVRSSEELLGHARAATPSLVIFDLNSARFDALSAVRSLKDDERLSSIPTLGFAAHVEADVIAAARAAGVNRVFVRSTFFRQLPEILTAAAPPASAAGSTEPARIAVARARYSLAEDSGIPKGPITLRDIYRAHHRVAPHIRRTPLVRSAWLSDAAGADVRLKLESQQVGNSFKARGTVNLSLALLERTPPGSGAPVVVTASAGNAGRAFAEAGEQLGVRAVVFTPRDAPRTKLDAIRRHGADLRAEADTYEDAERLAKAYAADHGLTYTSPFSHPDLIAGFGTVALEVFEDFPEVDVFVVPLGGGGLISGIAIAAKAACGETKVVGVEAEASHPFATSVREGRITVVDVRPTIADGLAGNLDPDTITFDLVRRYVDELAQVSEDDLVEGIRGLVAHEHQVAEGAGAAAVAAALAHRVDLKGRHVAIVVSGANIDAERLRNILG